MGALLKHLREYSASSCKYGVRVIAGHQRSASPSSGAPFLRFSADLNTRSDSSALLLRFADNDPEVSGKVMIVLE